MDGRARGWMECGWHQKSAGGRRKFFFVLVFLISLGSWKGSLKARAKVSLRSGARAENKNVVDPRFMGAAKTLTKSDACSIPLSYVAIHRNGVAFLCFTGATVRGGAERGFTRPCVDAHSYRLGASPKLSGPLASSPTSHAPVQLRRAFEPGRY